MRGFLILPLTKSAWAKGRIGPEFAQDWYRGLVRAVALRARYRPSRILILSGFQAGGQIPEADNYSRALRQLGLMQNQDFYVIRHGYETTGQLEYALEEAKRQDQRLVVIATWLHYPRVRYLLRKRKDVILHAAFGMPRPREAVTDTVLCVVFPLFCALGLRQPFLGRVAKRRANGKF